MTKRLILMALIAACGGGEGGDGLHALVACERTDLQPTVRCERPCSEVVPEGQLDPERCFASHPDAPDVQTECMDGTFEFEGVRGCCFGPIGNGNGDPVLFFVECE